MPARELLNRSLIQSSTVLVGGTVQKCVRVKICSLLLSCRHLLTEYDNNLVNLMFQFLCFISNSQVRPNGPKKHILMCLCLDKM